MGNSEDHLTSPFQLATLSETVRAIQAATHKSDAFKAAARPLKTSGWEAVLFEIHAAQTFSVQRSSFTPRLLKAIRDVTGNKSLIFEGSLAQSLLLQKAVTTQQATYSDDVSGLIVQVLGLGAARPIAGRVRAIINASRLLVVPVPVSGEVVCALIVLGGDDLTPDSLPFIEVLATHLVATDRRLDAQTQAADYAAQLNLIARIGHEAAAFSEIEPVLQRALHRLHRLIPGEQVSIGLIEGDYLVFRLRSFKDDNYQTTTGSAHPHRLRIGQEGVTGRVAASAETQIIADTHLEPHFVRWNNALDIRSELAVPMRYKGQVVGVLDLESIQPDTYNAHHADLMEAVAAQLAAIVATEQTRSEIESLSGKAATLETTLDLLASSLPVDEQLTQMADAIRALPGSMDVAFHLANQNGSPSVRGLEPVSDEAHSVGQRVILSGRSEHRTTADDATILGLPLRVENHLLGALTVTTSPDFSPSVAFRRHLESLASGAALAIRVGQLLNDNHRQRQLIETANVVSRVVAASRKPGEALEAILNAVPELVPCSNVAILLHERGQLTLAAESGSGNTKGESPIAWEKIPMWRRLMAQQRPLVVSDTSQDSAWQVLQIKSWIGVPLVSQRRLVGVLSVVGGQPGLYQPADGDFLLAFANQILGALDNSLLSRETDQLKDEIVQNISHELRNPLTFIKSYIEMLLSDQFGPLNDEQRKSLEIVSRKNEQLVRLANDIVEMNNVVHDTLLFEVMDIRDLVQQAIAGAQAAAFASGLELVTEMPSTPQIVRADSLRIGQVIDNLLTNAVKFSEPGGHIVARVLVVGDSVRVEVTDEGIGIPPQVQPYLFDRFYQVPYDDTASHRREGVGLGLAIAREIVEAHGGTIGVNSTPREGSTFYFELARYSPTR